MISLSLYTVSNNSHIIISSFSSATNSIFHCPISSGCSYSAGSQPVQLSCNLEYFQSPSKCIKLLLAGIRCKRIYQVSPSISSTPLPPKEATKLLLYFLHSVIPKQNCTNNLVVQLSRKTFPTFRSRSSESFPSCQCVQEISFSRELHNSFFSLRLLTHTFF